MSGEKLEGSRESFDTTIERPPDDSARVGVLAPDFDLPCVTVADRGRATLAGFRQKWLVLVFYPRDFSLVCPTELTALSARMDEFREAGADVLAVSVDSLESHERWLTTPRARGGLEGLQFALASDESGAVSRAYGVYLEPQHVALRGMFIIDPNGVLQFQAIHNLSIGRRTDDILRLISALQTGGLCAEDWTPGATPMDPVRVLGPGRMVSHYRIEERIGDGACARVYRARDTTLERMVALKVFRTGALVSGAAVLAEARAAAALSHPNICTVFAVDEGEGIPFIAMEYVPGDVLSDRLDAGPQSPERAADIGGQIARGMSAAHAAGIVHGDLKPSNVIVRDDGVVKILDFGLARLGAGTVDADASTVDGLDVSRGLKGTPAYMSPEQARGGRATRASDVFSLGVMLYEMASGERAFGGETIMLVLNQVQAVDPECYAAAIPAPFADLVRRTLTPDAGRRSITMPEIAEALGRVG